MYKASPIYDKDPTRENCISHNMLQVGALLLSLVEVCVFNLQLVSISL